MVVGSAYETDKIADIRQKKNISSRAPNQVDPLLRHAYMSLLLYIADLDS
jgi:hypothetical protein